MQSLLTTCNKLSHHRPMKLLSRRFLRQCAVTLILRENAKTGEVEVLMIQRALRKGDPWSGQMGFPGGRRDKTDKSNWAAAVRELQEELDVSADKSTRYVGRLSDMLSISNVAHRSMSITPYILQSIEDFDMRPNEEVADTIWVPLRFIANEANRKEMNWRRRGIQVKLPCYFYQGKRIWGMSLHMLDEMLYALHSQSRIPFHNKGPRLKGAGRLLRQK